MATGCTLGRLLRHAVCGAGPRYGHGACNFRDHRLGRGNPDPAQGGGKSLQRRDAEFPFSMHVGGRIEFMTAKDKLKVAIDRLSENEAADAEIVIRRKPGKPGRTVDEWGDLDELTEAAEADVLADLDAEEEAAGATPWEK